MNCPAIRSLSSHTALTCISSSLLFTSLSKQWSDSLYTLISHPFYTKLESSCSSHSRASDELTYMPLTRVLTMLHADEGRCWCVAPCRQSLNPAVLASSSCACSNTRNTHLPPLISSPFDADECVVHCGVVLMCVVNADLCSTASALDPPTLCAFLRLLLCHHHTPTPRSPLHPSPNPLSLSHIVL